MPKIKLRIWWIFSSLSQLSRPNIYHRITWIWKYDCVENDFHQIDLQSWNVKLKCLYWNKTTIQKIFNRISFSCFQLNKELLIYLIRLRLASFLLYTPLFISSFWNSKWWFICQTHKHIESSINQHITESESNFVGKNIYSWTWVCH